MKTNSRTLLFSLVVIAIMLLQGCANVKLKPEHKVKISSVQITKEVVAPESVHYMGQEAGAAALLGVVGTVIAHTQQVSTREQIEAYQKEKNIDIKKIVKAEFINELSGSGVFDIAKSKSKKVGDATIDLQITTYGLLGRHALATSLRPELGVVARMTMPDGTVVWRDFNYISQFNGETPEHTIDEYLTTNGALKGAYVSAAKLAVKGLVDELREN